MFHTSNIDGWYERRSDMTELMRRAVKGHIMCPEPDAVLNIETHLFNVVLEAESCEYDLDVGKELWLNRQRWSRLTREYVPRDPLVRFCDQAAEIIARKARDGATANMMFRDPDRYAKKHRWGGCLMGATFRGDGHKAGKPTITFYSRTMYMGYMALLDAAIANRIAAEIANRVDIDIHNIGFRWHISSQQLHCFKTLPYVYSKVKLIEQVEFFAKKIRRGAARTVCPPTMYHMCKWYNKVLEAYDKHGVQMLDHEKYGPFKRIKRRWLEHMGYLKKNVPPSLSVKELDFTKCE